MTFTPSGARTHTAPPLPRERLARQIGLFDATMLVMGGIVGAGIFMNPYVVAQRVHTPVLILSAWAAGGLIALLGAFIWAELASRLPYVGGQYAYLREAYHPAVGFLYGWALLLVTQTGGMAAVTVTFARYFRELTRTQVPERWLAVFTLAALTVVNCLGVKFGSRVQSALMVLKIAAIAGLVAAGLWATGAPHPVLGQMPDRGSSLSLLTAFGAAMVPVLFAFGGWQTTNFVAGEIKDPRRNLSRALLIGVVGVVAMYIGVALVCVRALGADGLARTPAPATAVMRAALGERGATFIALGITISTLGFLSQSILTAPRVYFAMAEDGIFFRGIGRVSARTRVPVAAIVVQSTWTAVVVASGTYEQILNYVVSMDWLFFGLTATCIFVFRRRDRQDGQHGYHVPGHPWTTALFVLVSWLIVVNTIYTYPANSLIGMGILLLGLPAFGFWQWRLQKRTQS